MKRLRTIVLCGGIGLLVLTTACNRAEEKMQPQGESEQIGLAKPEPRLPDPRIKIVQPAVDKGGAFLRKQLPQIQGMRPAYAGLVGLALLEGGLKHDDPDIVKLAEVIRRAAPAMNATYDLASSLFFLNRWNEVQELSARDRDMARTLQSAHHCRPDWLRDLGVHLPDHRSRGAGQIAGVFE